ncbi:MAG: PAS domain-containing protein [Legionellales bacterium]|nr:PAS domain-containing protein [Legionellales bacterium]
MEVMDRTQRLETELTDLKEELAQVKQALQRAESLLSLVDGHIYWKDIDGTILGCNLQQARAAGYETTEQFVGKTDYDYLSSQTAEQVKDLDKQVIQTQQTLVQEESGYLPDGQHHTFLSTKAPVYDTTGQYVIGIIGISIDITQQKQSLQQAIESKEYYESILNQIPGHVYWLDTNNIYLGCNTQQAIDAELTDCKEIIGKTNNDMIWKQHAKELDTLNRQVLTTGETLTTEENCLFIQGAGTWYSKKTPLYNQKKQIIGLLGISLDISSRKKTEHLALKKVQAEQALESQEYYECIISQIPGHVYWVDTNNIYLGCNDEQATDVGLQSRKEIIGKTLSDMISPEDIAQLEAINNKVMQTGIPYMVEEKCHFPTVGESVWFSRKTPLYNRNQKVIGMLGISINITDRKKSEQLLIENSRVKYEQQEAQKYAQRMKIIAANISHEMKTPLAGIKLTTQLIQQSFKKLGQGYKLATDANLIADPLTNDQLKNISSLLSKSVTQIDRASIMISMQLNNIRHNQFDKKSFSNFPITSVINEAIAHYPFKEEEQKVLTTDLEHDFVLRGDKILLQHVLWNLLKNALYHIYEEGKGKIHIHLERSESFNILYFNDTAKGMTQQQVDLIFNDFYSVGKSEGTGLGLTFCKSVMRAFGGQIHCRAKLGEFTEFTLLFTK